MGIASLGKRIIVTVAAVVLAVTQFRSFTALADDPTARDTEGARLDQPVVVSDQSIASDDLYEIILSNITFVDDLLSEHLRPGEIAPDALRSYYVDYYLAQVNNGGISQFVYNSKWSPAVIKLVREGLSAMNARQHLKLFDEVTAIVDRLGSDRLQAFLQSQYFDSHEEREALNEPNLRFFKLAETEDLVALNAAWLRGLPGLQVKTAEEMRAEVERRAAALPDREERKRAALENEPRYLQLMRALSTKAGHKFSHVTGGDPTHQHNGKAVLAWHFITDYGHHYMVEADGIAIMFNGTTHTPVTRIDAP